MSLFTIVQTFFSPFFPRIFLSHEVFPPRSCHTITSKLSRSFEPSTLTDVVKSRIDRFFMGPEMNCKQNSVNHRKSAKIIPRSRVWLLSSAEFHQSRNRSENSGRWPPRISTYATSETSADVPDRAERKMMDRGRPS